MFIFGDCFIVVILDKEYIFFIIRIIIRFIYYKNGYFFEIMDFI